MKQKPTKIEQIIQGAFVLNLEQVSMTPIIFIISINDLCFHLSCLVYIITVLITVAQ